MAVVSLRGGSGRTTTTVCLGDTLALARTDPVLSLDAVPYLGTLGGRTGVGVHCPVSVADMAVNARAYEGRGGNLPPAGRRETGLYVLPSETRITVRSTLTADAYLQLATGVLASHYPLIVTDTPLLLDPVVGEAVVPTADALLLTTTATAESASLAVDALAWLAARGYADLARRAVLVVNAVRPGDPGLGIDEIADWFGPRTRAVVPIPWDEHLAAGTSVTFSQLAPATRDAYLDLAAVTVSGLLPHRK
ncbi:MinD/ParA family protein [Streptomyces sp. NPDC059193]|uniref:MinD/ParA family ATP-binding protein n=1 Tax=Streptomyces sp. NPDC059193 TaxID=3346763 RepID=UPI0036927260